MKNFNGQLSFWKQKTFWACLASILTGVGGLFVPDTMSQGEAVQMIGLGIIGILMRQGIEKVK